MIPLEITATILLMILGFACLIAAGYACAELWFEIRRMMR